MELATPFNKSYPNQNQAVIHKRKWERYVMNGIEEQRAAACDLTHGGLKLYLYLCENIEGYTFWLSPKDIMEKYGMSKSTYDRAKSELIQKGYIIQDGNKIHFYANKNDGLPSVETLKKQINTIGKKLYTEGMEEEEIKEIIKPAKILPKDISEDEKIHIYLDVYNKLKKELEKMADKKNFL